ncbi:MAG: hypothetical protein ABIJ58_00895 [Nanoarchaeota archaeon]
MSIVRSPFVALLSVLILLIVFSTNFISSSEYPQPFVSCQPEPVHCSEGYSLRSGEYALFIGYRITDNCGYEHACFKIEDNSEAISVASQLLAITTSSISSVPTSSFSTPSTSVSEKSQAEQDCSRKGCFEDEFCYPFGYVRNDRYCDEDAKLPNSLAVRPRFVNQSEAGFSCSQNYECKTGFCSEDSCLNLTSITGELTSLRNQITILSQENRELDTKSNATNESAELDPRIKEDKNIFQEITHFFRGLFSFRRE